MRRRRRYRFRCRRRRLRYVAGIDQDLYVGDGEDALTSADFTFEPVIVHPPRDDYQLALGEGQFEMCLRDEIVFGTCLTFVWFPYRGFDAVVWYNLEKYK